MSEFTKAILVANVFRYFLVVAGVAFAYMGYRLFKLGYFEKAGELKAVMGEHHLLLKQVAPGVFFAALGTATIAVGAFRKVAVSTPPARVVPTESPSTPPIAAAGNSTKLPPCDNASDEQKYEGKDIQAAKAGVVPAAARQESKSTNKKE
jgi:hypothetical protein